MIIIPLDNYFSLGYFKKRQTEIARKYYSDDSFRNLPQREREGIRHRIQREARRKQLLFTTHGQK